MANIRYGEVAKDETFINNQEIDEGCEIDIEESQGLGAGVPVKNDGLPEPLLSTKRPASAKDSGLSSRMSEDGDRGRRSLLLDGRDETHLAQRLTRISEFQNDSGCQCQWTFVIKTILKVLCVVTLLYFFICTLDLLSNAFRLLGGKTAGSVFSDSELLANPITGLMIGVLATVILQSSSTSSSIVITMVASKIIDIRPAIPIIMGANIGTTVTNTLVSLAHSMDRKEFKRAFSGAVVHDVFNWLTVLILLPLEFSTGYLYHLTKAIISSMNLEEMKTKKVDLLKTLTKPLTSRIVMVDKKVITGIAEGKESYANKSLLKIHCVFDKVQGYALVNKTMKDNVTGEETWQMVNETVEIEIPREKCQSLLSNLGWGDSTSGVVLFIVSILLLSFCLYCMVKTLHSLLGGHIAKAARKTINADFPYPFSWLTGYAAIVVGAGMTILVQSSSVFTSALTPLVGIGCLKLERMFPLTLGSNIGTTGTGILAALASSNNTMHIALQLALCHLFFNITGILLFYPVPKMRRIVLGMAKFLGRTTARYRWFAIAYLIGMFLVFPGFFFALSFAGKIVFFVGLCVISILVIFIVIINYMQNSRKFVNVLPKVLRTWQFLPEALRSLAPFDRCLSRMVEPLSQCCCQCLVDRCSCLKPVDENMDMGWIDDSDDEDSNNTSVVSSYLPSVVSSKAVLNTSSSSGEISGSESRRIYKPVNSRTPTRTPNYSRRSSLVQPSLLTSDDLNNQKKVNFLIGDEEQNQIDLTSRNGILVIDMSNLNDVKKSDI